jgi:hypothetical protein
MVTCGKIRMTPVNGRTVRLSGDLTKCKTKKDKDNKLVSINCEYDDCDMTIKIGQTVRPKPKYPHRVNVIVPGRTGIDVVCYDLMIAEVNTTSVFALPFMGGNRKLFMWDTQFINAFMGTPEDENCICLLYRYSGDAMFLKFESALCAFRNFRRRYDPNPYHVMFVFDVPKSCQASYEHYVNGRYSEIDDLWKLKILEFHGFDIDGHTGKILFQSDSLRYELEEKLDVTLPPDSELYDKPKPEREIFDPEYYSLELSVLK